MNYKFQLRKIKKQFRRFLIGESKIRLIWRLRAAFENYFNGLYEDQNCYWDEDVSFGQSVCIQEPQTTLKISELGITYIKVKDRGADILLTICLARPGIFIGKAGQEINNLTSYLTESIGKPVVFSVKETKGFWEDQK